MKKKILAGVLSLVLMFSLSGCGGNSVKNDPTEENKVTEKETENTTEKETEKEQTEINFPQNEDELFSNKDMDASYDKSKSVTIELKDNKVICNSKSVSVKDNKICILDEGTYVISGTLADGMIIVDSDKSSKVHIVLDGVSITSKTSAALYVAKADKVFVTINEDTENELINGGSFNAIDDNNIDGAVFSKDEITFNGSGKLTVTSPAGHGIVSKNELAITGGVYVVSAASHAIVADDAVKISTGEFKLTAGKDGIHSENEEDTALGFVYIKNGKYNISAEGDGISASAYLQIKDGEYDIVTGGGSENGNKDHSEGYGGFPGGFPGGNPMGPGGQKPGRTGNNATTTAAATEESTSMKGIKAGGNIQIAGGVFTINSADDAIHSDVSVEITGGSCEIKTGDDGIHAEETLLVKGGDINITESYEGFEGVDIVISGGNISMVTTDDGINAAGGNDDSGFGGRDDMFARAGGPGGMMSSGNGSILISGGTVKIRANGDGIDANGTLEITGGMVTVTGPTTGDTATLDFDKTGVISGGTFIGTGAKTMAQTFSDSSQGVIALSVGNRAAGTEIIIDTLVGTNIIKHAPELDYAVIIISTPDMVKGESYSVTIGNETSIFEAK